MRAGLVLFRVLGARHLAKHRARTLLTVGGVALGTALLYAAFVAATSVRESLLRQREAVQGTADLQVRTGATAGIDAGLVDLVARTRGVDVAAPLLQERALVEGPRGARVEAVVVAYDDRAERLRPEAAAGLKGRSRSSSVATTLELLRRVSADGGRARALRLLVGERRVPLPRPRLIRAKLVREIFGGHVVVMPLRLAQDVFGRDRRVTRVLVKAADRGEDSVAALRKLLQRRVGREAEVVRADEEVHELEQSTGQLRATTTLLSLLALALGAYVVFNTVAVGIGERRREFATLLTVGETSRRLMTRVMAEAAAIGVLGGLVGLPLGHAFGRQIVESTPAYIEETYGFALDTIVPLWAAPVAVLTAVAVATAGAAAPAWTLLRLPPVAGLRAGAAGEAQPGSSLRRLAPAAGAACIVGAVAIIVLDPERGLPAAGAFLAGLALLTPYALRKVLLALGSRLSRSSRFGIVQLAGANLAGSLHRSVVTVSAAMFALAIVIGVGSLTSNVATSVRDFTDRVRSLDLVVSATPGTYPLVPLAPESLSELGRVPGVARAERGQFAFVSWRGRRVLVVGVDRRFFGDIPFAFRSGKRDQVARHLPRDGAVVSTQFAEIDGIARGDEIAINTTGRPRTFEVAAVFENLAWVEGALFVRDTGFASAFRQEEANEVYLQLRRGADPRAVVREVRRRVPHATVETGDEYGDEGESNLAGIVSAYFAIGNVCVLIATLSVLNAMLIAVLQRRREIAIQLAVGMRPAQMRASLVAEATLMVGVALAGAVIVGLALQAIGLRYMVAATGFPLRFEPVPAALLIGAVSAVAVVALGSLYPARRAARVPLRDAIAYE